MIFARVCSFSPSTFPSNKADTPFSKISFELRMTARNKSPKIEPITHDVISGKHVLVVGGSGRVGGSVVTEILKRGGLVTVGATSKESFEVSQDRWKE